MADIKVTIIVPVYNAEKYIEQCINSIINQSLTEIEIIIVNDGSVDNSLQAIKKISGGDARIQIIDQQNMGVSAARNNGIKMAQGEFIGFVDADDWVEANMFEVLYNEITSTGSDFAICNINGIDGDKVVNKRLRLTPGVIDLHSDKGREITNFLRFAYDNANWNKLYNTEILKRNSIMFNEELTVWEDLLFNLYYIHFANQGVVTDQCLYNYRSHQGSVMGSKGADHIKQFNLLYDNFIDFARQNNFEKEEDVFRKEILENCYSSCIMWALNRSKIEGSSIVKIFKQFNKEIKRINSGAYTYVKSEATGIRRIKENLLYNKKYNLFSILVVLRSYFGNSDSLRLH